MKKIIYFIALITVVLCFSMNRVCAQSASFLTINSDAQAMGMANTGSVMSANAFSVWNNGANTVFSPNKLELAAGYGSWQPSLFGSNILSFAGYGKIAKNIVLTAGIKHFNYKNYDAADDQGNVTGSFVPKELVAGMGIAVKILPMLSASINANYLTSDLGGPKKGGAFAADLGLLFKLKMISIGLTASNLGSEIDYGGTSKYSLPAIVNFGVGFSQVYSQRHKLTVNMQGGMLLKDNGFSAGMGLEYMYDHFISVRGGYHYGDENRTIPSYTSVGLGIKLIEIQLNVAYLVASSESPLRNSFLLSLGWGF